jgi:hypothetical protein
LERGHNPESNAVAKATQPLKHSTGSLMRITTCGQQHRLGKQLADNARLVAPNAARTANSCWRAVPCASSRIDTFPQPIANSTATAPKSKYKVPRMLRFTH